MKKIFTIFSLLFVALVAFADQVTYDFSTSIPSPWSASVAPNGFETTNLTRGAQFTKSAELTLKGASNVTKIVVVCSCNIASGNSMAVSVGGKSFGSEELTKENDMVKTFSGAAASGDIVISLTRSDKSIYIKSITVEGSVDGGNTGGGEGGEGGNTGGGTTTGPTEKDLNTRYIYSEPTTIKATDVTAAAGNNMPYAFIVNNILVQTSTGAITSTYFGCNAGNTITFTATKPIKGLTINGMVKKGFEADCDHGEILYVSDDEEDIELDPVLAILDIDSKSVTINCLKQMRCYSVDFFFDENPEIETGGGGDYNFGWEPDEATNLTIAFDELEFEDYTEYLGFPCTDMIFSCDDFEMEVEAFMSAVEGTVLPVGTYEFNDTYEDGTLQASPGGDDEYDYPAYISTDFEYYEEYDTWLYNTAYYIVSGTMKVEKDPAGVKITIDAKTAKGSTVKASFVGKAEGEVLDAINDVAVTDKAKNGKFMEDGRITIRKDGKTYTTAGLKLVKK